MGLIKIYKHLVSTNYRDIAKLMTLLNLFQEKEQYEKCAIVKRRITVVNKILKKYSK